jgi:hypothetical protein
MAASRISENPFCTRRIRPGAIPFLFPPEEDVESLVDRLRQAGWWGEIMGPHGSGKSTLLATLIPAVEGAGRKTLLLTLHDGQRRLPLDIRRDSRLHPPLLLVVDGYEQLSPWNRFGLKRFCRRRGLGLLVTAHKPTGLPQLHQTAVPLEVARQIIDVLLAGQVWPFTAAEVSESLSRHGGNLRETLFDLYDFCERRPPSPSKNVN